ncbi:MAG TPA: cytochrome D1 domain-containing protein [Polyangiaceae bacterium]|nr:cytochrome D1 domain-containing protein [Polyangiaceae bacterium]
MRKSVWLRSAVLSLFVASACSSEKDPPLAENAGKGGAASNAGGTRASGGAPNAGRTNTGGIGDARGGDTYGGTYYGGAASGGTNEAGNGNAGEAGENAGVAGSGGEAGASAALRDPSHGSPIALAPDERLAVVVNRDVGSVSIVELSAPEAGLVPEVRLKRELSLGAGSEPWQVVISPDSDTAFVVLKRDQRLVRIRHLHGEPKLDGTVSVGSEPTSVALSPSGAFVFVANFVDGTLSVLNAETLRLVRTVDLNRALVDGGYLGQVEARPALAHPRSILVTNNRDDQDGDEAVYITEYFAQQLEPEAADGSNADTRKAGLVYRVSLSDYSVQTIELAALADMGFRAGDGKAAGCYPNQLQSIAAAGKFAYVLSVCASPRGPLGVRVTTTACKTVADCSGLGLVEPTCALPFGGAPSALCTDVASVKTTTAPVVSVIDLEQGREVSGSARNLNAEFESLFDARGTPATDRRLPLFASDMSFVPDTSVAYVSANGTDAVFRLVFDAAKGTLTSVGASTQSFIDLFPSGIAKERAGKNPIGVVSGGNTRKYALALNDVGRNLSVIDLNAQALAGGVANARVIGVADQPERGSDAERILRGKRFFDTGVGRWSLNGEGFGACQVCHSDGLTDNVTWYFARGPRQATSLDGSFASNDPTDQRIFNWTAIFEDVPDFEANTRDISGGVGAIVSKVSAPPQNSDRIDFVGLKHAGLNGSSAQAADPKNPLGFAEPPLLEDWADIERYIQTIRSPRAPSTLIPSQVAEGEKLFVSAGCQGCHGGAKWTVSRRFYTSSTETNARLGTTPFEIPAGFPQELLPARQKANQLLRFGGSNPAALDQILCAIRPVGTFDVAEAGVGIAELRADMKTVAQGDGDPAGEGRGYNPPSLLGMTLGAPYLHAGSARTLEALFAPPFEQHYRALSPNFLAESDPAVRQRQIDALVAYLSAVDEGTPIVDLPKPGPLGGSLCPESF